MLTKVLPINVQQYWPRIVRYIKPALPPTVYESDEIMNNMLASLLAGDMQLWLLHNEVKPLGVVITAIQLDSCMGTKSLMIYVFTWTAHLSENSAELYQNALASLQTYARGQKCFQICAYSKVAEAIELAESVGANSDTRFLIFTIDSD